MQAVGGFRHAASDSERTHRTTVHLYDCPQQDKANKELLRKVVEDYKVGGLLFSGGLMQNQVMSVSYTHLSMRFSEKDICRFLMEDDDFTSVFQVVVVDETSVRCFKKPLRCSTKSAPATCTS